MGSMVYSLLWGNAGFISSTVTLELGLGDPWRYQVPFKRAISTVQKRPLEGVSLILPRMTSLLRRSNTPKP